MENRNINRSRRATDAAFWAALIALVVLVALFCGAVWVTAKLYLAVMAAPQIFHLLAALAVIAGVIYLADRLARRDARRRHR